MLVDERIDTLKNVKKKWKKDNDVVGVSMIVDSQINHVDIKTVGLEKTAYSGLNCSCEAQLKCIKWSPASSS